MQERLDVPTGQLTIVIFLNALRDACSPINIPTLMTPNNQVIVMPDPSNRNSSPADTVSGGAGHRSTNRALAVDPVLQQEKPPLEKPAGPSTEVFAVFGVEPEIQAYAMAKYSRSSLWMK